MPNPEILISISGMGDPEAGDTDEWAQALFPAGALVNRAGEKTMEVEGRVIHLIEVLYEESNEAVRQKFEDLGHLLPQATPEKLKDTLEDYALDVVENVLLKSALEPAQLRFVEAYNKALDLARRLVGESGNVRQTKIGVLSHSLGTLIAYEGICRAFDTALITSLVDVNVVMCAPMLAPIHHVMQAVGVDRYLTRNGCSKPYQRAASGRFYSMIRQCLLIYDRRDPFRLIQDMSFYERDRDADLVDEFRIYDSGTPLKRFWEGHSMIESYLANNREVIASWLLP
jgi:hypothetical protein